MTEKVITHFNKGTVFGRVDGVPTRKLSNEGKGRPFWRLKVVCANPQHGNVLAYGRIWNVEKAAALIDYLKKNPSAGIKLVGFFNQYDDEKKDKQGKPIKDEKGNIIIIRRSNYTWYGWSPDKCDSPRASFVLTGKIQGIKSNILLLHLERENSDPEDFELYSAAPSQLKGLDDGDIVKVKGYLRALEPEDEYGDTTDVVYHPYIEDLKLVQGDFA